MQQHYGALLSPPDSRDYQAKDHLARGVRPASCQPEVLAPVEQQGDVNCCVADSLALVKTYMEYRERKTVAAYSVDFIYHNRAPTHHQGHGMYCREALSQLCKDGVPERRWLPTRTEYPSSTIKSMLDAMRDLAKDQVISKYVACYNDDELCDAIAQSGAAMVVVDVPMEFAANYRDIGGVGLMLPQVKPGYQGYGLHAVTVMAYDYRGLRLQNSQGADWGEGGFAIMPPDYGAIKEGWSMVDKKDEWDIIEMWPGQRKARRNGTEMELDVPPQIINGRTMVPLRFAGEALGAEVEWIAGQNKVVIRRKR